MAKKKSGDNFPLDVKGRMMYLGSIVTVPSQQDDGLIVLSLGFISKLTQKNGVDVTILLGKNLEGFVWGKFRFKFPSKQINIIDSDELKVKDELHEAIRFAAKMIED